METSDDISDSYCSSEVKDRRRKLHTEAEQRRRDAIKRGFDRLSALVNPGKSDPGNSLMRMSKVTVLQRSINTITKLSKLQAQKQADIDTLRKRVQALKILRSSYERVSDSCSHSTPTQDTFVTETFTFQLFQAFMENLFRSFDHAVTELSLPELSEQIITWAENSCKPDLLYQSMESLLNTAPVDAFVYTQRPLQPAHQQTPGFSHKSSTECLIPPGDPNTPVYIGHPEKHSGSQQQKMTQHSSFGFPEPRESDQGITMYMGSSSSSYDQHACQVREDEGFHTPTGPFSVQQAPLSKIQQPSTPFAQPQQSSSSTTPVYATNQFTDLRVNTQGSQFDIGDCSTPASGGFQSGGLNRDGRSLVVSSAFVPPSFRSPSNDRFARPQPPVFDPSFTKKDPFY